MSFAARLEQSKRARARRRFLESLARWVSLCVPALGLFFLLALWLPPTRLISALLAALAAAVILTTFGRQLLMPLLRAPGLRAYALWLEDRAGLMRNELINALSLERDAARWEAHPISRELLARATRRGAEVLGRLPLAQLHATRRLWPLWGRAALGLLPFLAAGLISPPRFGDALQLFLCAGSARVIPEVELVVTPGDLRVERGASLEIEARVTGRRRPSEMRIEMRAARPDASWSGAEMIRAEDAPARDTDRYGFLASALKGDFEYRIAGGWVASPIYKIRVQERLQAIGYRKHYEPPSYTRMPPQREISSRGDLAAIAGSRVTLEVRHRRPGAQGELRFTSAAGRPSIQRMRATDAHVLQTAWTLAENGSYVVALRDPAEGDAWVSDSFKVEVVPDLEPVVQLLSPPEAIMMPPDMHVSLLIDCVDDFGMTELVLIYGRPEDDPARRILAEWQNEREARLTFNWNLEELPILPGQELHYYLQVLDNDPIHGPKIGETSVHTIRFPSMAEMYAAMDQQREQEVTSVEDAIDIQEELRKELKKVSQEMLREENISWEKAQEIEDLLERQEQLAGKIEEIQQSLDESRQRMETQNLFSMEMIDKIQEIKELTEQIQSEEFRQLLERMQRSLENVDRRELQQAMEEMKITQEEISQSLDRTLNMLKQLMAEEKLDHLMEKMESLRAEQETINKQLEQGAPSDSTAGDRPLSPEEAAELAARQGELQKQLEELQSEISDLQKECSQESACKDLAEKLGQQQEKQKSQPDAKEQMKQAQEALEQKDRRQALKFGRKASQSLEQMEAGMSAMKMEMNLEKAEQIARALYNIANRLIAVSMEQEGLTDTAEEINPHDLALLQQDLHDEIAVVGDSLFAVARETPVIKPDNLRAIAKALREIATARDHLESGRRRSAVSMVGESSRSLNAATKMLLEAATQAQSQCAASCNSPFNKMQSLTNQQSDLNEEMREMMGQCQTPRQQMAQGEAMMRMAARQEMIKQGLSEVREELGQSGKKMGELDSAVQEMEELVEEMRARNADRRLIQRQEDILSRLLSAQRSIRKRDESEERKSRVGSNPGARQAPGPAQMGESAAEQLRRAMLRGAKDPVPAEYRSMVDRYLRSLLRGAQ